MLPANFIERRQSVKEITCDLIQVARAGASRTGRDGIAPDPSKGGQSGKEIGGSGGSDGRSRVFISQELHEFAQNKDYKGLFILHYLTNFYLT